MKRVTVPFFISNQGCPNLCVYCDQRTINGSVGVLPTHDEIGAKIRNWRCSSGSRHMEVAFFGGTFTALPRQSQECLLSAVQPFLLSGEVASVRVSTRPDSLDTEIVQWLADRGVKTIEVGVQSMDDEVLAASGRCHDSDSSASALRCIKFGGLTAGAQLMPGLPGDTLAKSRRSLEAVLAAGADFIRLYPVVVFKGTELAKRFLAGEYQALSLDDGIAICKVLAQTALRSGVTVIRMGLQADEGLRDENIVAGCWHPAFGDLVYGELFYDALLKISKHLDVRHESLTVGCHPSRVSNVIGHGRKNIRRLREHGFTVERIIPNPDLSMFECEIRSLDKHAKGSIMHDLLY